MTRELDFYIELYQTKFRGDETKTFQMFWLPIGNAKITRKVQFHLAAPVMKYHQKTSNSCCMSSLASAFHCINDNRAVLALVNSIEESLTIEKGNCKNRIRFVNDIMPNRRKIKGEQNLRYNLTIVRENDAFDILNWPYWIFYFGTVHGTTRKCESWYQYIRALKKQIKIHIIFIYWYLIII